MIGEEFPRVLAAAREGDESAYAVIWRDANPVLLRYLRVLAPGTSEDVAAESWLTVVRGLHRFRGDETEFRAWLLTTARRRAVDAGRHRQRHPTVALGPGAGDATAPDAADLALEALDTQRALALVATLPQQQAEVVLLRVVAGLDVGQVAELLGCSKGAVRVAAHRGLRTLAEVLAARGVTP